MESWLIAPVYLDDRRLGQQRIAYKRMIRTLLGYSNGWKRHPALLLWEGSEYDLYEYAVGVCREWRRRGYRDTVLPWLDNVEQACKAVDPGPPPWRRVVTTEMSRWGCLVVEDPHRYRSRALDLFGRHEVDIWVRYYRDHGIYYPPGRPSHSKREVPLQ